MAKMPRRPTLEVKHEPYNNPELAALAEPGDIIEEDDGHQWLVKPNRDIVCILCPTEFRLLYALNLVTPVVQIEIHNQPDTATWFRAPGYGNA